MRYYVNLLQLTLYACLLLCILGTSHTYSNGGGLSVTSSSAGQSRFSAALSEETGSPGEILSTPNLKTYSFADLKGATRNFRSDSVLGVGGFGTVFKGWVDEKTLTPTRSGTGMVVAIKKLNSESMQGFEEWQVLCLKLFFSTVLMTEEVLEAILITAFTILGHKGKGYDNVVFTRE